MSNYNKCLKYDIYCFIRVLHCEITSHRNELNITELTDKKRLSLKQSKFERTNLKKMLS